MITRSARIAPRVYTIGGHDSLDAPLVVIRGNNITVDFSGATLQGIAPSADPDLARGVAILVDGGRNVRLIAPHIRGYHVAILVRGTRDLRIDGGDLSYNWKPRLFSLVEHESLVDWQSYHHNENREWMRYGSALFLEDVHGGRIRHLVADNGHNGLLMVRTDSVLVDSSDLSFNSGLGVGMYRSSDNILVENRIDYDVRGHSEGFYHRGQDSAGILMFEQCMRNVVAHNSVTHGGDGLFIWAGQHTMDTGEGGVNDNVFVNNDFSYAPANAMEATFSRNVFIDNDANRSDYGLWGGYSYGSDVLRNRFFGNRIGIAIEHGQDNIIAFNMFFRDSVAISLWGDSVAPSDWGYPKHRDIRSRDYEIRRNSISDARIGLLVRNTQHSWMGTNDFARVDSLMVMRDTAEIDLVHGGSSERRIARVPSGFRPHPRAAGFPRSAIIVDDWGPFDWRSPKLWPLDSTHAPSIRLRTLGPFGTWRVIARAGLRAVIADSGRIGDTIVVIPSPDSATDWRLTLEYHGADVVTPRGERVAAAHPYTFAFGVDEPRQRWTVHAVAFTDSTFPRMSAESVDSVVAHAPNLLDRTDTRLDYEWYRPKLGFPLEHWAMIATTDVDLDTAYTIRTIADDGVRVWVDGTLVIDDWTPGDSRVNLAPISAGHHALRVAYYQNDGWTELRLDLVRGADHSRGTPGPH